MKKHVLLLSVVISGCQHQSEPQPAPSVAPAPVRAASATPSDPPLPEASAAIGGFDAERVDSQPKGMSFGRTGKGAAGRWLVLADPSAPSPPNVLAQTDADPTDYRFPIAVLDEPVLKDVRASVHCKPVSGHVDQACGLVVRYKDENDYYLTRANALENNVDFYIVKDGQRKQLATFKGTVTSNTWHALSIEARGDRFTVMFDGKQVLEHQDRTFSEAGHAGLWTKADSVTYFDDLKLEPL